MDKREQEATVGIGRLDDQDYPAVTMGQAAELLGVQPAFLRSLDAADVLHPTRSTGGHRRYSRRQLELAARMRSLFDQGNTLEAAYRILSLEDELATARHRITELEQLLSSNTLNTANNAAVPPERSAPEQEPVRRVDKAPTGQRRHASDRGTTA